MGVVLPFAVGLGVVVFVQRMLGTGIPADSPLFRLFRPSGGWVMAVVPAFILFAVTWTLTHLLLFTWRGRRVGRDLRRPEIRQLLEIVGREPFEQTLEYLRSAGRGLSDRRVGRRLAWLLHHLEGVEPQRGHELLRHRSDLDRDAAATVFRIVTLSVLAMPLMGLVGTVLGVGIAADGFSNFLVASESVDDAGAVTTGLTELGSGLAFAFDVLLFGLASGVVAGVIASWVRARDVRSLADVDELGLELIARVEMRASARRARGVRVDDPDRLEAQAARLMEAVEAGVEGLTNAVADMRIGVTGLGDRVRSMEDANKQLSDSLAVFGKDLESFRNAQSALTPVLRRLSGPLEFRLASTDRPVDRTDGGGTATDSTDAHGVADG